MAADRDRWLQHEGVEPLAVTWMPAPGTRWRWCQRRPRAIVLHSAECAESLTAAESLGAWLAGPQGPANASWHYAVDRDSVVQSVECQHIAWHAGIVNAYTIGIEQAGRAQQRAADWSDDYSAAMLDRVALLLAHLSVEYGIPLVYRDHVDVAGEHQRGGFRGVTTHADVTRAFRVRGGHTDPGPGYPMEAVLARALALGGRET
jgi:N-acetyl-anhydromuramyl-L-alanine amidase AmpD